LALNQSLPWFVAVGYRDPHLPWRYPGKFGALYDGVDVPSTNHSSIPTDTPPMAWQWPLYFNGNYGNFWNLTDPARAVLSRAEIANATGSYYATISYTDSEIGRLIDALKSAGQAEYDSTLIALWSDHGQNVGEHATWCKMSVWEHSLRVAFMVKPPSRLPSKLPSITAGPPVIPPALYAGKAYEYPMELLDLYPTLVDLAALPKPQHGVEGDSLVAGRTHTDYCLVVAFRDPATEAKSTPGAISQTTRCFLNASGMSGNQWPDPAAKNGDYYAACVRVDRTKFNYMGYSLRTEKYRCVGSLPKGTALIKTRC
jgi:arylsulfatase A-like enzyme